MIDVLMNPQMNDDKVESDYLPEPPTPTRRACPISAVMILEILQTCFIASSKRTKSITALVSLYSLSASDNLAVSCSPFWN